MAWMEIPLSAIPFQIVNAVVNGQNYRITVRQLGSDIYTSLVVDDEQVTNSVMAAARGKLIPWSQTIAQTMLYWIDTQGNERPQYSGLGDRWRLVYEASE